VQSMSLESKSVPR